MSTDNISLYQDVKVAINKHSVENRSNTPDFILAQYLMACLNAYESAVNQRDRLTKSAQKTPPTEPQY